MIQENKKLANGKQRQISSPQNIHVITQIVENSFIGT